jgi:transcriptional regulator with XRE-family HTH domain
MSTILGRNCRTLREGAGLTRADIARTAKRAEIPWTTSKLNDVESGRQAATLELATELAYVLSIATGSPVSLADLIATTGRVAVSGVSSMDGARWSAALLGGHWPPLQVDPDPEDAALARQIVEHDLDDMGAAVLLAAHVVHCRKHAGLTEQRVAKRLGLDDLTLARASAELWTRTFSEERDHRAGPGNAQRRGQVTRALQEELRTWISRRIEEASNGDD